MSIKSRMQSQLDNMRIAKRQRDLSDDCGDWIVTTVDGTRWLFDAAGNMLGVYSCRVKRIISEQAQGLMNFMNGGS